MLISKNLILSVPGLSLRQLIHDSKTLVESPIRIQPVLCLRIIYPFLSNKVSFFPQKVPSTLKISSLPHRNVGSMMASDGVGVRVLPPRAIAARYRRERGSVTLRYVIALLPRPLYMKVLLYHSTGEKALETAENHEGWETIPSESRMARDSMYVHPQCRVPYHQQCFVVSPSDKVKYYNRPNLAEVSPFPFNTSPTIPIADFTECLSPPTALHAARPLRQ